MTKIIIFIVAVLMTVANIIIAIVNQKHKKISLEIAARLEAIENRRGLREYQKRRMCNSYCKYRDKAKTQEELDLKCYDCPVGEL